MKKILEKLWDEYLSNECAVIDTDEERALAGEAVRLHEGVNNSLSLEQQKAVEEYIDALCDIEGLFVKKAFFSGCKFATAFLLEVLGRGGSEP